MYGAWAGDYSARCDEKQTHHWHMIYCIKEAQLQTQQTLHNKPRAELNEATAPPACQVKDSTLECSSEIFYLEGC